MEVLFHAAFVTLIFSATAIKFYESIASNLLL